ncbi:MAG: sugar phosphate nucleotidyltransferase, partial [Actinomycetota bacterium]
DVGGDIIPMLVEQGVAEVYDFARNEVAGSTDRDRAYWRDVGTLDSYYEGHMDLLGEEPAFNVHNTDWPILTWNDPAPPAKFASGERDTGAAEDSLVSGGAIVRGRVHSSILGPDVVIHPGAEVYGSVLMNHVEVQPGARVRNAIVDKNVVIPEGATVGVDVDMDRARFVVSDGGIVVIGKGQKVE